MKQSRLIASRARATRREADFNRFARQRVTKLFPVETGGRADLPEHRAAHLKTLTMGSTVPSATRQSVAVCLRLRLRTPVFGVW